MVLRWIVGKFVLLIVFLIATYSIAKKVSSILFRRKKYRDGSTVRENALRISYEEFKKFYDLNPDAWEISKGGFVYRKRYPEAKFALSYGDYMRCEKMMKSAKHLREKMVAGERAFDEIKADIRETKRISQEEIGLAKEAVKEVTKK